MPNSHVDRVNAADSFGLEAECQRTSIPDGRAHVINWWGTAGLGKLGNVKLELSAFECVGMNPDFCLAFAGPV